MSGQRSRRFLLCLLLLGALCALAQESGDDSDDDGPPAASLSLQFERQGSMNVSLDLSGNETASEAMPSVLASVLHCPPNALAHPGNSENGILEFQKKWTAEQRERYEEALAAFNERRWTGKCDGALTQQGGLAQGDFDFGSFAAGLRRAGIEQLFVNVNLPQSPFEDHTHAHLVRETQRSTASATALVYQFSLKHGSGPVVLHLAYGFRHADLYRGLAILAGFLVVPVLLTLWMRRGALAPEKEDAAGAWFGFFKSLNWMLMGAMLLWITSGLGARRLLQDYVANLGLSVWSTAAADVLVLVAPAFLLYLACMALSFPVYARLRQGRLSRREFLVQQIVTVGAQAVPLVLGLSALEIIHEQPEAAIGLLILTFVILQMFQILKLRVLKTYPQALTTGELRDRVFALASRLGVVVNQVFVLPAGKGQVANAYAAKNKVVMFTDYLLAHLSKREVDAIAAHELAHLQQKHPMKRGLAFMAALFLPSYFNWLTGMVAGVVATALSMLSSGAENARVLHVFWSGVGVFGGWSQRDFVLVMLGLMGFYFLSRRYENVADATAVRLTGDPEAQITGLLKVNRLNQVPIQWGKAAETWLTHPSTVRRAQRIAAAGGMAPERLQQILREYMAQGIPAAVLPAEERYAVPVSGNAEKTRSALRERTTLIGKMWIQMAAYVLPPAVLSLLSSWLVPRTDWGVMMVSGLASYVGGMAITVGLVILSGVWLGEAGRSREKMRLTQQFAQQRAPVGRSIDEDIVVGFAPGPYPRLYGTKYHWDSGFLVLAKDRLQFVGEQVRFSLLASEIDGIVTGRGGPSWWKFERVYVRWKSADGAQSGVFNLNSLEPGSIWQSRSRVKELCRDLQRWRAQAERYPAVRPEFAALQCPELGEVTSASPARIGKWSVNVKVLTYLLPLAAAVGVLTHTNLWTVCSTAFLARMVQTIPYWRYRDVAPGFPAGAVAKPMAAGAS